MNDELNVEKNSGAGDRESTVSQFHPGPNPTLAFFRSDSLTPSQTNFLEIAADSPTTLRVQVIGYIEAALFIAEHLAGGVIGQIGADIWNNLLGKMSAEDLYSSAMVEIQRLLNAAIAKHELDEAIDATRRAAGALRDYRLAPANRLDTLANAEAWSRTALSTFDSERHTVAGYGPYLIAAGLQLAILQERLTQFRDPNEVAVIRANVDQFSDHLRKAETACRDQVPTFFSRLDITPINDVWGHEIKNQNATYSYRGEIRWAAAASGGLSRNNTVEMAHKFVVERGTAAYEAHKAQDTAAVEAAIADGRRVEAGWHTMANNAKVPS